MLLPLSLLFVGAVLVSNGLWMFGKFADREVTIINFATAGLTGTVALLGMIHAVDAGGFRDVALTLLFTVTYLWVDVNRQTVSAVRVPCISVSAIDAVMQVADDPGEEFPAFLRAALAGSYLIGMTEDACVSTDFRGRPESLVVALPETRSIGGRQLRVFGWYDTEWGFSARMLELAQSIAVRRA